jgi:hypothetical protein
MNQHGTASLQLSEGDGTNTSCMYIRLAQCEGADFRYHYNKYSHPSRRVDRHSRYDGATPHCRHSQADNVLFFLERRLSHIDRQQPKTLYGHE